MNESEIRVVEDAELAKIFMCRTRCKIMAEIANEPKSISQLSRILGISPPAVYYHIKRLEKGRVARLTGTRKVRNNLVEKFYRATATYAIVLGTGPSDKGPVPSKRTKSKRVYAFDRRELEELLVGFGVRIHAGKTRHFEEGLIELLNALCGEARVAFTEILSHTSLRLADADMSDLGAVVESTIPLMLVRAFDKPQFIETLRSMRADLGAA